MLCTFNFSEWDKPFPRQTIAVHLVMKIMLINTQGMYIFPQYLFFSQLPKIKIALTHISINTLIPHCMDLKQVEVQSLSTVWTSNFLPQRLPSTHTFQTLSARWSCSEMMAERKQYGGMGQPGLGLCFPANVRRAKGTQSFPCCVLRRSEFHSNVHTSRSWTMKSSFLERMSLLKVLQELLRPWYKSASSHKPNRPPPPPSSKELMSPLIKYEFSPLHLKTLKLGLNVYRKVSPVP